MHNELNLINSKIKDCAQNKIEYIYIYVITCKKIKILSFFHFWHDKQRLISSESVIALDDSQK